MLKRFSERRAFQLGFFKHSASLVAYLVAIPGIQPDGMPLHLIYPFSLNVVTYQYESEIEKTTARIQITLNKGIIGEMMIIAGLYPLNKNAKNHKRGNVSNKGMKIKNGAIQEKTTTL